MLIPVEILYRHKYSSDMQEAAETQQTAKKPSNSKTVLANILNLRDTLLYVGAIPKILVRLTWSLDVGKCQQQAEFRCLVNLYCGFFQWIFCRWCWVLYGNKKQKGQRDESARAKWSILPLWELINVVYSIPATSCGCGLKTSISHLQGKFSCLIENCVWVAEALLTHKKFPINWCKKKNYMKMTIILPQIESTGRQVAISNRCPKLGQGSFFPLSLEDFRCLQESLNVFR